MTFSTYASQYVAHSRQYRDFLRLCRTLCDLLLLRQAVRDFSHFPVDKLLFSANAQRYGTFRADAESMGPSALMPKGAGPFFRASGARPFVVSAAPFGRLFMGVALFNDDWVLGTLGPRPCGP